MLLGVCNDYFQRSFYATLTLLLVFIGQFYLGSIWDMFRPFLWF